MPTAAKDATRAVLVNLYQYPDPPVSFVKNTDSRPLPPPALTLTRQGSRSVSRPACTDAQSQGRMDFEIPKRASPQTSLARNQATMSTVSPGIASWPSTVGDGLPSRNRCWYSTKLWADATGADNNPPDTMAPNVRVSRVRRCGEFRLMELRCLGVTRRNIIRDPSVPSCYQRSGRPAGRRPVQLEDTIGVDELQIKGPDGELAEGRV